MQDTVEKSRLLDDGDQGQGHDDNDIGTGLDGSNDAQIPYIPRGHVRAYSQTTLSLVDEDDAQSSGNSSRRSKGRRKHLRFHVILAAIAGAVAAATCLLALYHGDPRQAYGHHYEQSSSVVHTVSAKPPNFPVIAMVFYGRRRNVEILDCYLRRNLISNGGLLSRVHFIVHTTVEEDIAYLNETLLPSEPLYTQSHITVPHMWGFTVAWEEFDDPDALYIKIDDDVLYFSDDTIPHLIHAFEQRPDAFAVAANAVNEYDMAFLAYHNDIILPFLPEQMNASTYLSASNDEIEAAATKDWRPSNLPAYPINDAPPLPASYNLSAPPPRTSDTDNTTIHRWLPLPVNAHNLKLTPIARTFYTPDDIHDTAWTQWSIAAQQHYSFLTRLDTLTSPTTPTPSALSIYHYGNPVTGLWNTQYNRYSINFMAMRGRDIHDNRRNFTGDDEVKITQQIPRELGRPFLVQTRALVAHFSYGLQYQGMHRADVRARYRGFASEVVCGRRWGTGVI